MPLFLKQKVSLMWESDRSISNIGIRKQETIRYCLCCLYSFSMGTGDDKRGWFDNICCRYLERVFHTSRRLGSILILCGLTTMIHHLIWSSLCDHHECLFEHLLFIILVPSIMPYGIWILFYHLCVENWCCCLIFFH